MRVYSFNEVVGNFGTVSMIKSSLLNKSFPNFSIMSGDSGTGKSTCAEIVSLALNCTSSLGVEPCLHCENCKTNLKVLMGKGSSTMVKKINVGRFNEKSDVNNMITEIFKLESQGDKVVFILEECHELPPELQSSLLEEIDKLDDNVYVIMCTTRPRSLLEELRNRAISFRFSSLKNADSRILLNKLCVKNKIKLSSKVEELILKKAKGVPRTIVNLTEFISKNSSDYDSILEFLGEINPEEIRLLFDSVYDLNSYYIYLNDLVGDYTTDNLVYCLKNYLLDLHYLSLGVSTVHSSTTQADKKLALRFGKGLIVSMQKVIHSLGYKPSVEDFSFAMLRIMELILKHAPNSQEPSNTSVNTLDSNPNVEPSSQVPIVRDSNDYNSSLDSSSLKQQPSFVPGDVSPEMASVLERLKSTQSSSNIQPTGKFGATNSSPIANHINAKNRRDDLKSVDGSVSLTPLSVNDLRGLLNES